MNINEVTEKIIGLAIKVHINLGPGILESVYEKCLSYELKEAGFSTEIQKPIQINYNGIIFEEAFRADIIVNDLIILELKSVKTIEDVHTKQLLTYLRLTNKNLGLLINFNESLLKNGIKRVINGIL